MAKLIMTTGLPGSGKTTWANEQLAKPKTLVVCKDEIRRRLEATGWCWSPENEVDVIKERDRLIIQGLKNGWTVISADTNLAPKHQGQLQYIAQRYKADFEVKSFLDVPPEVCVERDSQRSGKAKVGEKVIWEMWEKYVRKNEEQVVQPYVRDNTLPAIVICDLDGTLCLHNGRGPFEYEKANTDLVNRPVWQILWGMYNAGTQVVYLSGREARDGVREVTEAWLRKHGCPEGPLYMRAKGDYRKDNIVKYELFNNHIRKAYAVQFVLDDRDQVVEMWRKLGLTCLQVAYGKF